MDPNSTRLEWAKNLVQAMVDHRGLKAAVETT